MNQEKISELIKNLRKEHHLTQEEFASFFHVTYQAVSKWERGINLPDINTLKSICDIYNLDINEFLSGEYQPKKKYLIIIPIIILLIIGVYLILRNNNQNNYEFKPLTTSCENFEIKGSIAYSDSTSSIYISDIIYCGSISNTTYKTIKSSLHETNGNLIKEGDIKENTTIEEYLKSLSFYIEHYNNKCENNTEYYLEIYAVKNDHEENIYKIPLSCK